MSNLNDLIRRRGRAAAVMQEWRSLVEKVYSYAAPNKNMWRDSGSMGSLPQSKGQNLTAQLYDLTLVIGTRTFVNRLVNALIPQTEQWLRFIPGVDIDEDSKDEVARLLQGLTKRFFQFIDSSNFYLALPEAFEDMAISTGVIQINEGDDDEPLVFSSVPSNSIAYEVGIDGGFKGYFRDFVGITIPEIEQFWPNANIPEDLRQLDKQKGSNTYSCKQVHVVEATLYDYKTKMWDTTIFELNLAVELDSYSEEEPAFAAFRWNRRSGEAPGRGPAMDAMPAAASINEAMKDELISAAFKANPMYMAYTDSVINLDTFNISPGAIMPVLPTSAGTWPISPIPNAGDINFGILVVQDLRQQIDKLMFSAPLGPVNLPRQTATEATLRMQELNENAAASFSRIKRELFDQIIKRIIYLLRKRGEWPDIEVNGKKIAIRYETPLTTTRGQREAEKLVMFHQALAGMIGPEMAIASMKVQKVPFFLAENLEVDLDLVTTEKEIEQAIQQAQQAAEQQQEQMEPGAVVPQQ